MKVNEIISISMAFVALIFSAYSLYMAKVSSNHSLKVTISEEVEKGTRSLIMIVEEAQRLSEKFEACLEIEEDKEDIVNFVGFRDDARFILHEAKSALADSVRLGQKTDAETLFSLKKIYTKQIIIESKIKTLNTKVTCEGY